jgi:SagB-type dehydrogenase family enzyme
MNQYWRKDMDRLTHQAIGLIGQATRKVIEDNERSNKILPPVEMSHGLELMKALGARRSHRDFLPEPLSLREIGNLLWAAGGVNRPDVGGRTVPSAMNAQEIDLYLAMTDGLYLYDPRAHLLQLVVAKDVRRATGYQDFVDSAPLDFIYVTDHSRMSLIPASKRSIYASICAGAMAQNVSLYCAATGLASVVRAWFDRGVLAQAMCLNTDRQILITQTVGQPRNMGP